MATNGRSARTKGSSAELKLAKELSAWWGLTFHRTVGSGNLHWDDFRVAGDIVPPIDSKFPFCCESKKHDSPAWTLENAVMNNLNIPNWWAQCLGDARSVNLIPMLAFTRNRAKTFIMLPYDSYIYVNVRNKKLPVMRTTTTTYDKLKDIYESFDVMVMTLEGLVSFTPEEIIEHYTDYDWEAISLLTHLNPIKEPETKSMEELTDDVMGKLKNL